MRVEVIPPGWWCAHLPEWRPDGITHNRAPLPEWVFP
jgi:hypothetical protein